MICRLAEFLLRGTGVAGFIADANAWPIPTSLRGMPRRHKYDCSGVDSDTLGGLPISTIGQNCVQRLEAI